MSDIEALRLAESLSFDHETGQFRWTKRPSNRVSIGDIAGTINGAGYRQITLGGKFYYAHRLVWLFTHGVWPESHIDHVNLNKDDNRIENLRLATRSQNLANSGVRKNNKSGIKGVYFDKDRGCWIAKIMCRRRRYLLGQFLTGALASAAYAAAAEKLHGEFARVE
jgi:hypothetical protein